MNEQRTFWAVVAFTFILLASTIYNVYDNHQAKLGRDRNYEQAKQNTGLITKSREDIAAIQKMLGLRTSTQPSKE